MASRQLLAKKKKHNPFMDSGMLAIVSASGAMITASAVWLFTVTSATPADLRNATLNRVLAKRRSPVRKDDVIIAATEDEFDEEMDAYNRSSAQHFRRAKKFLRAYGDQAGGAGHAGGADALPNAKGTGTLTFVADSSSDLNEYFEALETRNAELPGHVKIPDDERFQVDAIVAGQKLQVLDENGNRYFVR